MPYPARQPELYINNINSVQQESKLQDFAPEFFGFLHKTILCTYKIKDQGFHSTESCFNKLHGVVEMNLQIYLGRLA
jgi:hypothetical protein